MSSETNNAGNFAEVILNPVVKDNIEHIFETIEHSKKPLLYAILRNPEPDDSITLYYDAGQDFYSKLPWYKKLLLNPFAKPNFIYSDRIYSINNDSTRHYRNI